MKKKDQRNWEIKERDIVVILFEETKEFFINETTQANLWKYYDEHYRERLVTTRNQFALYKQRNQHPPMFRICTVNGTIGDTYIRKMEVAKYFIDNGYSSLVKGEFLDSVEEFTDWDKSEFYLSIKDIPVEAMCAPEKELFPDFKSSTKNTRTEKSELPPDMHRIRLLTHEEEYKKLKRMAKKYNTSMSEYILECTRNGGVIQLDTNFMEVYARKVDNCYDIVKEILIFVLISQNCLPEDIVKLERIKKEMAKITNDAATDMARFYRNFTRLKQGKKITEDQMEG